MATRKILYKHIAQTASTYIGRAGGNPIEVLPGQEIIK
jgi:hypothetical protein